MPTLNYGVSLSGGGISINQSTPVTADAIDAREVSVPVASVGTLSTRTDDDTGVLTVGSGHGITTSDLVDVYWSGGARFGMTCSGAGATTIGVDGGAGDVFPSAASAITADAQIQVNAAINGDEVEILGMQMLRASNSSTARAHASFQESDNTEIAEMEFQGSVPQVHHIAGGATNIFTGDPIAKVKISNGSSTETATFKLAWVEDSTP
jgi:hypothetical protein